MAEGPYSIRDALETAGDGVGEGDGVGGGRKREGKGEVHCAASRHPLA